MVAVPAQTRRSHCAAFGHPGCIEKDDLRQRARQAHSLRPPTPFVFPLRPAVPCWLPISRPLRSTDGRARLIGSKEESSLLKYLTDTVGPTTGNLLTGNPGNK